MSQASFIALPFDITIPERPLANWSFSPSLVFAPGQKIYKDCHDDHNDCPLCSIMYELSETLATTCYEQPNEEGVQTKGQSGCRLFAK